MSDVDPGPCDHCGEPIGEYGWMKPTDRTHEGLPIVRFYCSGECSAADR